MCNHLIDDVNTSSELACNFALYFSFLVPKLEVQNKGELCIAVKTNDYFIWCNFEACLVIQTWCCSIPGFGILSDWDSIYHWHPRKRLWEMWAGNTDCHSQHCSVTSALTFLTWCSAYILSISSWSCTHNHTYILWPYLQGDVRSCCVFCMVNFQNT